MKTIFKNNFKILLILISIVSITGCGESDTNDDPYSAYFSRDAIAYDYYEIADGTILHTALNEDVYNVNRLYPIFDNNQITEHAELIDGYLLENIALNINETIDVYKQNYLNLFTNKSHQSIYQKGYGLREIKTNYCNINTNVSGCETYVYVRKL